MPNYGKEIIFTTEHLPYFNVTVRCIFCLIFKCYTLSKSRIYEYSDVTVDIASSVNDFKALRNNLKNQRTFFFTRMTRFLNMFSPPLNSTKYEQQSW